MKTKRPLFALSVLLAASAALSQTYVKYPLTSTVWATTAPLNLFVSSTGNDSGACTSSGSPCLTIQGALNQVPRMVRHPVEITVGPGTFAGASIEGFTFDRSNSATASAWIHVSGTLITATATTGSPSGTATSGTTGAWSDGTVNTVTVSGAGWTSNDFQGKLVRLTSGTLSGQSFPITGNSSTVISFTGNIGSAPTAGNTFTVLDWGTDVTSTVAKWAAPSPFFSTLTSNFYGFVVQSAGAAENVSFNQLRITTTASGGAGVLLNGSTASFTYNKFDGSTGGAQIKLSNTSRALAVANTFSLATTQRGMKQEDDGTLDAGLESTCGKIESYANAFFGQGGVTLGRGIQLDNGAVISQYDYFLNVDRSFHLGRTEVFINHDVMVNGTLGVNYSLADDLPAGGEALVDTSWVANMTNGAIAMNGAGRLSVKTVGGTGNAVGLRCWTNCLMVVTSATSITGTTEISLDSANFSLATLRAASPRTLLDNWYGSRITQSN